jgi:hypothetical protein
VVAAAIFLASIQMLTGAYAGSTVHEQAGASNSWTFLAYMSADVPGSPLNWTTDINEMEEGLYSDNITVVALVDPDGVGDSRVYNISHEIPASDAIVSPQVAYPPISGSGEANMGDPGALIDFVKFGVDDFYRGGRLGIILWGHGEGWNGVCQDRGDYLTPQELDYALASIKDYFGRPLDIVVFDACSMGSIEVLSALTGSVSYSVSSEIPVPAPGFPYDSILKRVSTDLSLGAADVGTAFADEYVKFGALMANVTSQAAVINLAALEIVADSIGKLGDQSALFIPVAKENLKDARNCSYETDGLSMVDLQTYLTGLASDDSLPRRLSRTANESSRILSASVMFNRAFISHSDADTISPANLTGLSIFLPQATVQLAGYLNVSEFSMTWGQFLEEMFSNTTYQRPDADARITLEDLRFDDGLMDSFAIRWNETAQVESWAFDVLRNKGFEIAAMADREDGDVPRTIEFRNLTPDVYDVCAYGLGNDGTYRYYEIFENITVMKRYQYLIHFPEQIADNITRLEIVDLRTDATDSFNASGSQMELKFDVPGKFRESDNILLQLKRGNSTLAWGMIELTGDNAELTLTAQPQPSALTVFIVFILVSALLGFAAVRLLRVRISR